MLQIKHLSREKWNSIASQFRDLSYRQCSSYAEVAAQSLRAKSEFVGIYEANDLIGVANLRIKHPPLMSFGIAYLNHGPLISKDGSFSEERFSCCLHSLQKEYVAKRGLVLRVVPPLYGGLYVEAQNKTFKKDGFQSVPHRKPNETFILDLTPPLSEIRKHLDAKWRGHLGKSERSNLHINRSMDVSDLDAFEPLYSNLIRQKRFTTSQGLDFFRQVQKGADTLERMVAHLAWHDNDLIAGHIGSFVGDTATYLLGATTPKGRELRASYLLQWAAIAYAKSNGNTFYDLGGIDQIDNPNVFTFKRGLNGRRVQQIAAQEIAPTYLAKCIVHFLEWIYRGLNPLRQLRSKLALDAFNRSFSKGIPIENLK